jgi:dihydroxyacetone kinase-like protein
MYLIYRKVGLILKEKKISAYHVYVGEFATSLEMAGASISLLRLDDELTRLLARPARTPFFEQAQL